MIERATRSEQYIDPIHILVIEDNPDDAELLLYHLKSSFPNLSAVITHSNREFGQALSTARQEGQAPLFDVILSDWKVPGYDGFEALQAVQHLDETIPFIVISGTIGDEAAATIMKAGAYDFILKDHLANLAHIIVGALKWAEQKREEKIRQALIALQQKALEAVPVAMGILDEEGIIEWVNPAWETLTGWKHEELVGLHLKQTLEPVPKEDCISKLAASLLSAALHACDGIRKQKHGDWYHESMEIIQIGQESSQRKKYLVIRKDLTSQIQKRLELEIDAELSLALKHCRQPEAVFITAADILKKHLPVSRLGFIRLGANLASHAPWFGDPMGRSTAHLAGTEYLVNLKEAPYALCAVEWNQPFVPGTDLVLLSALDKIEPALIELEAEKASHALIERLSLLDIFRQAVNRNLPLEQALQPILAKIREILKADALAFYVPESDEAVVCISLDGFRTDLTRNARIAKGQIFVGLALQEKRVVETHDLLHASEQIPPFHELVLAEGFESQVCIPVILFGESKGILEFLFRRDFSPDREWLAFAHAAAYQIGIMTEIQSYLSRLEQSYSELEKTNESIIEGLSSALEFRDEETEGHTQRVTTMFMSFARRFFGEEDELKKLRIGSLLHDIGKIGVPDAILSKPGPLTPEERLIMQKHPLISKEILSRIPSLACCMDIPLYHHEKYDGTGYPFGLKGQEIPLTARIFAVIDVYEALISDRPYRKAWTKDRAIEYIRDNAGTHFDPDIVLAFLEQFS